MLCNLRLLGNPTWYATLPTCLITLYGPIRLGSRILEPNSLAAKQELTTRLGRVHSQAAGCSHDVLDCHVPKRHLASSSASARSSAKALAAGTLFLTPTLAGVRAC